MRCMQTGLLSYGQAEGGASHLEDSDDSRLNQATLTEDDEDRVVNGLEEEDLEEDDFMDEDEGEGEGNDAGLDGMMFPPQPVVRPHRYCLNCTGRVPLDRDLCFNCGHAASADAELFLLSAPPPPEDYPVPGNKRVALLFDERMELHDEARVRGAPHPERPDRIRAVVARLMSTGLNGEIC